MIQLYSKYAEFRTKASQKNILVVDDDLYFCSEFEEYLRDRGHYARSIFNSSGIEKYLKSKEKYDLIILDVYMPGMDILQILESIRKNKSDSFLVIVSGRFTRHLEKLEAYAIELGLKVISSIKKPFNFERLDRILLQMESGKLNQCSENNITEIHNIIAVTKNQLHEAIVNYEFLPFYQLQYAFGRKKIIRFEALARWKSPKLGLIQPKDFITLVGQHGLFSIFTLKLLDQVCEHIKMAQSKRKYPVISINIPPSLLCEDEFIKQFIDKISNQQKIGKQIFIEITEEDFRGDWLTVHKSLLRFRLAGVRISVDDFGTGYSNYSRVMDFPVDEVKIDRSLTKDIEHSAKHLRLVKDIVQMAHHLDISVVAEGVDSKKKLELLKKIHCDFVQGYYIGKATENFKFNSLNVIER